MRFRFSEYPASYEEYKFPYKVWAIEDSSDERDELLNMGFVPSRMKIGLWYLARSMRVDLSKFSESSENRRVVKNTSEYGFSFSKDISLNLSDEKNRWVFDFAKSVAKKSEYSSSSVKRVFSKYLSQGIFVWERDGEIAGYVPVMITKESIFYWLGFYKEDKFKTGLGSRMMLEAIKWATDNGKSHAYLGTVYTNSSLYKTNFKGWEFFNGFEWSNDKDQLKYLIGKDRYDDSPELLMDEEFKKRFYDGRVMKVLEG